MKTKHDLPAIHDALRALAASGAERPKQVHTTLGRFLSQLTCETSPYFDAVFNAELRASRPDWFRKSKHDPAGMKAKILAAAEAGQPRSSLDKRALTALQHYIAKRAPTYDADFADRIMSLCPDWFFETRFSHEKEKILQLAQQDGDHPAPSNMCKFTRKSMSLFDAEFTNRLMALRPEWFDNPKSLKAKKRLVEFATTEGTLRPSQKNSGLHLYRVFRRYTRPDDPQYDPVFAVNLRSIRPDWFRKAKRIRTGSQWTLA